MNKSTNFNIYKEDWYILAIFIMMAIAVVVKSYFDPDGYLSPDSTKYLQLAQNLLEGTGYYVSAYGITGKDREFFALWPAGYPTLIFLTSKLTGFSVFWASKTLNIILIGVILGIFRVLFKHNAYVYGLIFFFASYIRLFTYTWSETFFIAALVWFSVSIYLFITNPKRITVLYISLMLSSLLLFMSRYIGAFSFGLIGLLGLYYAVVKKDKVRSILLIGIAGVNISIMVLYLYYNYVETGFTVGVKKIPSPETNLQLLSSLIKALMAEATIYSRAISAYTFAYLKWFVLQFIILSLIVVKYRKDVINMLTNRNAASIQLSVVFASIGLVYLFFVILMRWTTQFDLFNSRLLAPGSFLLFVAIIFFIQQRGTKQLFNAFKGFLLFFAILSYLSHVPYSVYREATLNPTYFQNMKMLKEKYIDINKDSIVVFAPKHINYLYTDIQVRRPYSLPIHPYKEKWLDFLKRVDPQNKKHIYFTKPKKIRSIEKFDKSVMDFIKKYDEGALVKIQ